MRRHLVSALFASFAFVGPAGLAGAAELLTAEAPPVGPFDSITISGNAELVLVQGSREAVTVQASPKDETRVRIQSADGKLTIDAGSADDRPWWGGVGSRAPTVTVYFKTLESLAMSGAVKMSAAKIEVPSLRVTAAGATTLEVPALKVNSLRFTGSGAVKGEFAGSATDQDVRISGAGTFRAPNLVSQTSAVVVSGAGKVVVNATKKLDATISGAGTIEYRGDPELIQRVSGVGKIRQRS